MLAGVVLAVLSAALYNLGFVVEKWALGRMPEVDARRPAHLVRTLVSSRWWLSGFALLLLGLLLQVLALSRVSIAVVQPILASGILLLLLVSRVFLRERMGRSEWGGLVAMLTALVLIGVSADKISDTAGMHGTLSAILAAAVPTTVVAFMAFGFASRMSRSSAALFGLCSGLLYGAGSLALKEASTVIEKHGLADSIPRLVASADPYLFVFFTLLGLLAFQTGLQRCKVSIMVPVSNVISGGYLVGVGALIFGEHLPAEPWRLALRMLAFAGVVVGMVLLARGQGLTSAFAAGPDEVVNIGVTPAAEPSTLGR
jgi:drug/metabolite transporter (DMT)-like permease